MSNPTENPPASDPPSAVPEEPVSGRRRFLRGGLGAAPVVMTLVSRPVLAQQCCTPSALCSGNASTPGQVVLCTGLTPDYWKQSQHFNAWTPPYYPTMVTGEGTKFLGLSNNSVILFNSVFAPPYPNQGWPGPTLLQVLEMDSGPNDVGRYIVASLLNVAAGKAPVLTIASLKGIWSEYITTGSFSPTAGVSWNHSQIVAYLQTTMS